MKIGDTVKRQDKPTQKWSNPITITTQTQLEYHRDLKERGIPYVTIVTPKSNEECESCSA